MQEYQSTTPVTPPQLSNECTESVLENLDTVVERLRESKEQFANQQTALGDAQGRQWAARRARFEELDRLDSWEPGYDEGVNARSVAAVITAIEVHWTECSEFWHNVCEVTEPSDDYVCAFVDAAVDVYRAVKDRLDP